ncbi:outer membrane protein [Bradyrhizobium japonicum]|uniref:outer membrane protein n=1 Tax=Bradyrhizobium japonicum TaxID=375 RepID=UPI001BAC44B9|nr:outer membrane protein [Bradyrhizobium japonicum]MBR0957743.1 porin family protein [Bradyrhizobium japonicum]
MKRTLICLAALACSAAAAAATDLPVKAARSIAAPPLGWTGFYAGVQGGYQWSQDRTVEFALGGLPTGFTHRFHPGGGFGGVHVGYNHQIDRFVVGIEGDAEGGRVDGGFTLGPFRYDARKDWEASIRGRLGYTPTERLLLYVTGGVAFTELRYRWADNSALFATAPVDANISKTGWTAGVGGEAALTNRISARLEYRYSDFGTTRFLWPDVAGSYEQHPRFQSVRGGVSFRF